MPLLRDVVLVADDDPTARELMVDVLEFDGFSVVEAQTGRAALYVLDAGLRPCLIVTDLLMPDVDGWQLLASLDRLEEPRPMIAVLSSLGGIEQVRGLQDRYGCVVLRKPDDLGQLVTLARRAREQAGDPGRSRPVSSATQHA